MAEPKSPTETAQPKWRFETWSVDSGSETLSSEMLFYEDYLDRGWHELLVIHTPFRRVDQEEYSTLIRRLQAIELLFLERPELDAYYDESYMNESYAYNQLDAVSHETRETGKVVALQSQFMEDAFYVLQLGRYGNAPDNRGWMNLFRRWGRSPTFNDRFDALRSTFSEEFVSFFDLYIRYRYGTIEESSIPHPWDRPDPERGPGIFLDSGLREVSRSHQDGRTGERPVSQPGAGAHGVEDEKGGSPMYEKPHSSGDPEGGGSTSGGLPNA